MKEIFDIIKAYDFAQKNKRQTALATVVKVEGSSYRRPGARMLVTDDGGLTGAISGGCLEGDALRKALQVMHQQKPMLVTYDTTDEDDAKLGIQLGCNGIVQILIEPVVDKIGNAIEILKNIANQRGDAVIATLFSLENKKSEAAGTYGLLTEEVITDKLLPEDLIRDMQTALIQKSSFIKEHQAHQVLIEYVPTPVSLIIFGGGNDAIPLVKMSDILGWQTTVVDGRTQYATPARFPQAQRVLIAKPADALQQLAFDNNTAVVLMTHNYNYDLAMLEGLLHLPLRYIGSLGPKVKLQRMLGELGKKGCAFSEEELAKLHGPTGLDLGSETAEEIALSIISEIKMVMSKRNGKPLRKKQTTIHAGN